MNMVLFEHCKEIENGSLFKSKSETKEKVLNKSKSLVKIFFEIILLGVHSYKVHSFDVYKKLG